jgi:predicted enzyme related to lactoylglutathione lyase
MIFLSMMSNSKKVVNDFYKPVFSWKVRSKTDLKKYYTVSWNNNIGFVCDCDSFRFGKNADCKHIRLIKKKYERNKL